MNNKTMKNLPVSDRPFEKFNEVGSHALSDRELLTILIRSGGEHLRADEIARNLMDFLGSAGLYRLTDCTMEELLSVQGIGKVKAVQLIAAAEIAKRIADTKRPVGNRFTNSAEIADYYMPRF